MIYLDNSATTPCDERVVDAMLPYLRDQFGNPSSIYSLGRSARLALEDARAMVASVLGADESEIVFTSGGTESNNHAVKGAVFAARRTAIHRQHIAVSSIEHHSILEPAESLKQFDIAVDLLPVDSDGIVTAEAIQAQCSPTTTFVSVMAVNNETGVVEPLNELIPVIRNTSPNAFIHTDAVQAIGKIDLDVHSLDLDMLTMSAHKLHGPKGIGALYIRRGIMIEPLHHGGAQERNRRGGTEAVALAVGFAKAVELWTTERDERRRHLRSLAEHTLAQLRAIPEVVINTPKQSINSIINFTFTDEVLQRIEGDALIMRFDLEGIAVSNGSACTSGALQPSHVLLAMGRSNEVASRSVRLSFSHQTTLADIDRCIEVLKKIIAS
jgi:cysteine desulfurase